MSSHAMPIPVEASSPTLEVAVIIPVSGRYDNVVALYRDYKQALEASGRRYQFTYVLDGHFPDVLEQLCQLQEAREPVRVIKLARQFGEATALTAGFQNTSGDIMLTLPAYYQVEPSEIPKLLDEISEIDMVVARRHPRTDSRLNRLQTALFNWTLRTITGSGFRDLGCGVRAFKRRVAMEIPLYGDQHRFLPLLADRQGYRIKEIDVAQSSQDRFRRFSRLGAYPRRVLDMLTVFFLVKFTKKPLRFFGLIGATTFTIGAAITLYLVIQRLFFEVGLAERPALLLSALLIVLGVQIFALGLLGELIIFAHARELKEYTIEEIIN